jgi:phosphonate transport system substrate-binding protein
VAQANCKSMTLIQSRRTLAAADSIALRLAVAYALLVLLIGILSVTPARSEWRAAIKVLRIGIVADAFGRDTAAGIDPFRTSLETALDIPVRIVVYDTAPALIAAHSHARVHYAIYSASAYAATWIRCRCVVPLVAARARDGKLGYHAILLVRPEARYRSLGDIVGQSFLFSGRGSVAGDLLPRAAFRALGVDSKDLTQTAGTAVGPLAALTALLDGEVEAAFAWSSLSGDPATGYSRGSLRQMAARGTTPDRALRIIWRSPMIPHGPHAIHTGMPRQARAEIVSVLEDLADLYPEAYDAVQRVWSGGFEAIGHSAYQPLIDLYSPPENPAGPPTGEGAGSDSRSSG